MTTLLPAGVAELANDPLSPIAEPKG